MAPNAGPRLDDVALRRHRKYVLKALQWCGVVVCLVGLISIFLPHHEVRDTSLGTGLACAFTMHGCSGGAAAAAAIDSQPYLVHTGWEHYGLRGVIGPFILLGLLAVVRWVRPRLGSMSLVCLGTLACGVVVGMLQFDLDHMFQVVTPLPAEFMYAWSLLIVWVLALALPFVRLVLHVLQRREDRREHEYELPQARVV